nr:hypothetical protein Iba_chr08eCG2330 [Ipomoea batatas]
MASITNADRVLVDGPRKEGGQLSKQFTYTVIVNFSHPSAAKLFFGIVVVPMMTMMIPPAAVWRRPMPMPVSSICMVSARSRDERVVRRWRVHHKWQK